MSDYKADSLEVLEGLDPVRRRPGMYTDTSRPNHLAHEIIDNSVDEALAGHADRLTLTLHPDQSIEATDNGRGMPTDIHPTHKLSGVELILTRLHAGAKFSNKTYQFSGGLHGVGVSVVNALAEKLVVTVKRNGAVHTMSFAQGKKTTPLTKSGSCKKYDTGTTLHFWPEKRYFDSPLFATRALAQTLRAKAVLCPGLTVVFNNLIDGTHTQWCYQNGLQDYLTEKLDLSTCLPTEAIVTSVEHEAQTIDWAIIWQPESQDTIHESYVNLIPTPQGGTHVNGLRTGLIDAMRNFCERHKLLPRSLKLTADDLWDFCHYVLSVKLQDPQFAGQTKERLSSREAAPLVASAVKDSFSLWLNQHVETAKQLAELTLARAQKRLRLSKKVARKKILSGPVLPGKLSDCSTSDRKSTELFLVEGDSAGGSAKQARDRKTQAIMPLRGKILNTWEVGADQVLLSDAISDIASAMGADPGSDDISQLRYGKICILADADSDGLHITSLLCALFVQHFPAVVKAGRIFVAMPPLYRIDLGKQVFYALDNAEKDAILERLTKTNQRRKPSIQRFKGLGEMNPSQLRETTLNPDTRRLVQLTLDCIETTHATLDMLLAKKRSADRRQWLEGSGALSNENP